MPSSRVGSVVSIKNTSARGQQNSKDSNDGADEAQRRAEADNRRRERERAEREVADEAERTRKARRESPMTSSSWLLCGISASLSLFADGLDVQSAMRGQTIRMTSFFVTQLLASSVLDVIRLAGLKAVSRQCPTVIFRSRAHVSSC